MHVRLRSAVAPRVLLPVLALASITGAGVALSQRPPVYEATANVVVTPLRGEEAPVGMPVFRDLGDPIRTIETAAALLADRRAAQLTAQRLGTPWTAETVFEAITVRPQGQTNLVDVVGRADSPEQAAEVANAFTSAALDLRTRAVTDAAQSALTAATSQLEATPPGSPSRAAAQSRFSALELLATTGDPSAQAAQDAVPPRSPSGLPPTVVLALAATAGVLAAVALAVVLGAGRGSRTTAAAAPALLPEAAAPASYPELGYRPAGRHVPTLGVSGQARDAEPA